MNRNKYFLFVINPFNKSTKEIKQQMNEKEIEQWLLAQDEQLLKENYVYGLSVDVKGIQDVKCFHYAKNSYEFINTVIDQQITQMFKQYKYKELTRKFKSN